MIHIAGYPVRVGKDGMQRCAWCGHVLFEVDHGLVAWTLSEDGTDPGPPRPWEVGALVRQDGNMSCVVPHVDGDSLPAGCCANPPLRAVPIPAQTSADDREEQRNGEEFEGQGN